MGRATARCSSSPTVSGWWELQRIDPDAAADGVVASRGLCPPAQEEFGGPLWKVGQRWFLPLDNGLLAVMHGRGATTLGILDPDTGELVDAAGPWTEWAPTLAVHGSRVIGIAAGPHSSYEIVELDTCTGRARVIAAPARRRRRPGLLPRAADPHLHRPRRAGHPRPPLPAAPPRPHRAPDGELPPYVVWAHGGPTSHAPLVLDLEIAYFTSRGIGVAEVNYGGSTGYGRAYRDRLRGQWGVVDVEDCAAVARALADEGTADRARLAIRGGSAGGWTTAASLTATDLYACGTISYPILDLAGWATGETHDFESQYLESLVGPLAEVPDRYRERSPLHRADRITAPFLLLQGLDDVICPPAQCERFLAEVAGRGMPHAYLPSRGRATASAGPRPCPRPGGRTLPVRADLRPHPQRRPDPGAAPSDGRGLGPAAPARPGARSAVVAPSGRRCPAAGTAAGRLAAATGRVGPARPRSGHAAHRRL